MRFSASHDNLKESKIAFASVLAGTSGAGTLCDPSNAILSGNTFFAALQMTACSLFPGTHWSRRGQRKRSCLELLGAAPINTLMYFGLGWIGYNFVHRFKTKL